MDPDAAMLDNPYAGGSVWDVAGNTVVGVLPPRMIGFLRWGSETVCGFAETRLAEHERDRLQPWHSILQKALLGWRIKYRYADSDIPPSNPLVDLEVTRWLHVTHTDLREQLPSSGGVVQLHTSEQAMTWMLALYDHHNLARIAAREQPADWDGSDPERDALMAKWFYTTLRNLADAAERAHLPEP